MLVGGFDGCKRCVSRVFHECFAACLALSRAVSRCLALSRAVSRRLAQGVSRVSRLSRGCLAAVSRCLTADSHCESVQETRCA